MNKKIKEAFASIHADELVKKQIKLFVYNKTNGYNNKRNIAALRYLAVAAAFLLVIMLGGGGYVSYAVPAAAISVDINPSIELELNIYDKIVGVKGYGEDGIALAEELSVKNMNYSDAINCILKNERVIDCMKQDSLLEVTVTSASGKRAERLKKGISAQTDIEEEHIYCSNNREGIEAAHSAGISFGKYRAFLELHESNPDVSIEDIRNLTMREIRNMMGKEPPYGSGSGEHCGGLNRNPDSSGNNQGK